MRKSIRAAVALGAAVLLLAAGEAPDDDLAFLNEIATDAPAGATLLPAIDFIEESHVFEEPELGPILPEASTLGQLVGAVRSLQGVELDSGLKCLATAVYFESKGEPLEGQLAVAQVILNRVEDGRFGRDICSVVKAPRQFSFVRGGEMPTPRGAEQWNTARAVAIIASSEGWDEIVPDATHFHATRVNPRWNLRRVATVGQHIFYR